MKRTRKLGLLSVTETQKLLGAAEPIPIGKLPTDPIGMRMIGSLVRERLVSRGGRPSDPAWTMTRKVPMRPETWAELERCAQELQGKNIRVSAGQVAAMTLEKGIQVALKQENSNQVSAQSEYCISQSVRARADQAYRALSRGGFF